MLVTRNPSAIDSTEGVVKQDCPFGFKAFSGGVREALLLGGVRAPNACSIPDYALLQLYDSYHLVMHYFFYGEDLILLFPIV